MPVNILSKLLLVVALHQLAQNMSEGVKHRIAPKLNVPSSIAHNLSLRSQAKHSETNSCTPGYSNISSESA